MSGKPIIQPIETVYQGYRFRSRLEARWAVFFDSLRIPFEYEKEGYDLNGIWYLPDFWLPRQECWVEIKGGSLSPEDEQKAKLLSELHQTHVCIFRGQIEPSMLCLESWYCGERVYPGCVWYECTMCKHIDLLPICLNSPCLWCEFNNSYQTLKQLTIELGMLEPKSLCHYSKPRQHSCSDNTPRLQAAYTAARQARFEHESTNDSTISEQPRGRSVSGNNVNGNNNEVARSAQATSITRRPKFSQGTLVQHATFGMGTVVACYPQSDGDEEIVVEFSEIGRKRLLASFAPIEVLF